MRGVLQAGRQAGPRSLRQVHQEDRRGGAGVLLRVAGQDGEGEDQSLLNLQNL